MNIKRWWPLGLAVVATAGFGLWVGWRARRPVFSFLGDQKPYMAEQEVPDNFGRSSPDLETVYGFKADPDRIVAIADRQLLRAGWRKEHWSDLTDHDNDCAVYTEPGGLERIVLIEPNVSLPLYDVTSDIGIVSTPEKGWVGITVTRPEKALGWWDRAKMWLSHVFRGSP
ncbi:MAG TPA: hypothetical protein VMI31_09370 [Fimbriimonadaceae bacterium]|nr:hypothetical protein [Fimbriimonadaceae bacterium]